MSLTFHAETIARPAAPPPATLHGGCLIAVTPAAEAAPLAAEWADLRSRAIEPVPFCRPDVLLPAAFHLADAEPMTLVTARDARDGRLIALLPLAPPSGFAGLRTARLWHHPLLPLATPPVDREDGERAVAALLAWLAARRPAFSAFSLPAIPLEGPVAGLLRPLAGLAALSRPAAGPPPPEPEDVLPADGRGARDGVERFLAADATPGRLAAGTAILQDAGRTAWLRAATRAMAATGDLALVDDDAGRPPALAIRVGRTWRRWLAAGDSRGAMDAGPWLADLLVPLGGSAPAGRMRGRVARALWFAARG